MNRPARVAIRGLVGAVAAAVVCLFPATANAQFTAAGSANATHSSATLIAPTNVSQTPNCSPKKVTISWTATASTYATGYAVIYQADGGAPQVAATVSAGTTSAVVSINRGVSYTFAVYSTFRSWYTASPYTSPFSC